MSDLAKQIERINAKLKGLGEALPREVRKELYVGGLAIEGDAKISIQSGAKSGRVYQKYSPRRTHQASAAGQAPASDTGALVASVRTEQTRDGAEVKAGGSDADYAIALEFGTSNMSARPFMTPAFESNKKAIFDKVETALNKVIQDGVR